MFLAALAVSLSHASHADAQVKPRFMIAFDSSGSMVFSLDNNTTYGDGVGRPAVLGDSAALTVDGVFYGCGTTAGLDRDCDGLPNDSRMSIAKEAVRNMIHGFGDVEWALARFSQSNTQTCSPYTGSPECSTFAAISYGNPQCNTGTVDNDGCVAGVSATCRPGSGVNTSMRTYDNTVDVGGLGDAVTPVADFNACVNYTGSCTGGNVLVGFPGIATTPFATLDNRPAILKWMDNVETNFQTGTTSGNYCSHATTGNCELRPSGATPLGGILSAASTYMTPVRTADSSAACRPYSVILLTDGAETCNSNPTGQAATLLSAGIRTYVVGVSITASDQASLNAIASSGGTTSAYFASSETELAAALSEIVNDSLVFETCNGLDDDCDSNIDEDLPAAQPGASAQPEALFCDKETNRTLAQNTQVRARSDFADTYPLTSPVTPAVVCGRVTDTCELPGTDDDCDGAIDEDGTLNACGRCPGALDLCDGVDNDCDGRYDEGTTMTPFGACPQGCTQDVPCGSDVGFCQTGFYRCVGGVLATAVCDGEVTGGPEVCDQVDNDCNGIIDDPATLARVCPGWPTSYVTGGSSVCVQGTQFCARAGETADANGYRVDGVGAAVCSGQVRPETRERCDSVDHDCNGNNFTCTQATCTSPTLAFVGNACGTGLGVCVGELSCDQNGNPDGGPPALVCNAPTATPGVTPEPCNNIDDDCDGTIDENAVSGNDLGGNPGGAEGAFCGSVATNNGVCNRGLFACVNGFWQCEGEIGSSTEICDGVDNDCDNLIDTSDPSLTDPRIGQQCGTSIGECEPGLSICTGGGIECPPLQAAIAEDCNGLDDDCDYLVDENLPDDNGDGIQDVQSCGVSLGLCEQGTNACVADPRAADGFDYNCLGGVTPSPEICDGEDNDCDGATDECSGDRASPAYIACNTDPLGSMGAAPTDQGLGAGGGDVCGTNVAPCTTGKTKCVADINSTNVDTTEPGFACVGNVNGTDEICDGADQDCDTKIDENIDPVDDARLGVLCGDAEVGNCRIGNQPCGQCRFGIRDCVAGEVECVGVIGPDMYESCNGTDDDCDLDVDECVDPLAAGCIGEIDPMSDVGDLCGEDQLNACGAGRLTCQVGELICLGVPVGSEEICDGIDNDCDGNTDENILTGAPCGSSVGECRPGTFICDPDGSGDLVCDGAIGPSPEVCDGLDNNCMDGVDEGLGVGGECGSDVGECSTGHVECVGGRDRCVGEEVPGFEVCDCLDNDCDGEIDENTGDTAICGGTAECVMCQCALPCTEAGEFTTQCPQGKAPVQEAGACFCVGSRCQLSECAAETKMQGDEVLCAPDNTSVGTCECRNNECASRCAGVLCDDGLVCDKTDGRCKQATCLLAQLACDDDQRCARVDETFSCIDDACFGVTCDADEACRLGDCVKSCARVECENAERCVDGDCVPALCLNVSCTTGETCDPSSGECVAAGECVRTGCTEGEICDTVQGECEEDPCLATHCPYGEQCDSVTSQCELRCASNLLFCEDGCVNPQNSREHCGASGDCRQDNAGETCAEGLLCSRGECSDTCADGLVNCGDECLDPQTDLRHCGATADCMGSNDGDVCQTGFSCVAGACQSNNAGSGGTSGGASGGVVDGKRVIASGGGGCTCSVPGSREPAGSGSKRGAISLALFGLGIALLGRRKRYGSLLTVSQIAVLLVAASALMQTGCSVDTFCLDCPSGDSPLTPDDGGLGGSGGTTGGSGGTTGGSGGGTAPDSGTGGSGGMSGGAGGDSGIPTPDGGCVASELCNGIDDDCDDSIDEDADPAVVGIDVMTDPLHCGGCGRACALEHAYNKCENAECAIDRELGQDGCDIGYFDHDDDESNGCEYRCTKTADDDTACDLVDNDCDREIDEDVDFASDPLNCGACGLRCTFAHAPTGGSCVARVCALNSAACEDGFRDHDDVDSNGCEYRCPVFPTTVEICNRRDDDCDGTPDEMLTDDRIGAACGDNDGECTAGRTICDQGIVTCDGAVLGSVEVCDGLDNDCDGDVDTDHPDIGDPCGTVVPGSECSQGTFQIPPGGCANGVVEALICMGGQGPVDEVCDGRDNDCDGQADEAVGTPARRPGAGQLCTNTSSGIDIVTTDPDGLCTAGTTYCVSGNLVCRDEVGPEPVELCDAFDHDCDGNDLNGFINEGGGIASVGPDPALGDSCGIDTGECSFGTIKCDLNAKATFCDGGTAAVSEICDGKDNDCDGRIDERPTGGGVLAGESVACVTGVGGSVNTSPPASASTGECNPGTTLCSVGAIRCSGQQGPRPELCDNEDWDCDGDPINGVAQTDQAVGDPCGLPTIGQCRRGATVCASIGGGDFAVQCAGATPTTTDPAALPATPQTNMPEAACDGIDNDCDGATDEGSVTAYPGAGGSCCDLSGFNCCPGNSGTMQCNSGLVSCVYPSGAEFPQQEVCGNGPGGTTDMGLNIADDDCDGTLDEGFDLNTDTNNCGSCGRRCEFNVGVTNGNAVLVCAAGNCAIGACVGNFADVDAAYGNGCEVACTFTGNEICDGIDNDCNGIIDTDVGSLPTQVCTPARTGVCAGASNELTPACENGQVVCNINGAGIPNYQVIETLCDGLDNDCDRVVDEGYNIGVRCDNAANGACFATGNYVCTSSSSSACNAPPAGTPTAEVCDNIDNNCDGIVDNFTSPSPSNPIGNFEIVNLGASTNNTLVMANEASRPDALVNSGGSVSSLKPCSVEGVQPWANVTWTEASAACCRLNANGLCAGDGQGWRLCDASTFAYACQGPAQNCDWAYSDTPAADCNHASGVTTFENTCHGAESTQDAVVVCGDPGDRECAAVTASSSFPQCFANWTGGAISDISGNVQEWTNTIRTAPVEQCRTFVKTGLPLNVPDFATLSSVIAVSAYGTVTSVRLLDFTGDHTADDMDDADVFLVSPAGTSRVMFQDLCSTGDGWAMDLQDGAPAVTGSCNGGAIMGVNINTPWAPEQSFGGFAGQTDAGNWTLQVRDDDAGGGILVLQSWTLEVCSVAPGDSGYRDIRGGSYNDVEPGRSCGFDFEIGSTSFRFPTTGFRCCWYPATGAP